jgi:hypothetical protein
MTSSGCFLLRELFGTRLRHLLHVGRDWQRPGKDKIICRLRPSKLSHWLLTLDAGTALLAKFCAGKNFSYPHLKSKRLPN